MRTTESDPKGLGKKIKKSTGGVYSVGEGGHSYHGDVH